jgi:hypothetical protein
MTTFFDSTQSSSQSYTHLEVLLRQILALLSNVDPLVHVGNHLRGEGVFN